jgi:hypothetical protein
MNNKFAKNGMCVDSCGDKFFNDNGKCTACDDTNCKTCTNANANTCTACLNDKFL